MKNELRMVRYDADCRLEAYWFRGILQAFPNHFHDYYVIGYIESGRRSLVHNGREYALEPGDLLVFNPKESHACVPADDTPLDYRSLNIPNETMLDAVKEITGGSEAPLFDSPVQFHSDLVGPLAELHGMIMRQERDFRKEELFYFLLAQLLADCTEDAPRGEEPPGGAVETAAAYLERRYGQPVTLDELAALSGYSKYHFLRAFTKEKGISPYAYLETVRICKAKELLQSGVLPAEAAARTGFADQSHLGNAFKRYIGLTPKQYWRIFASGREKTPDGGAKTEQGERTDESIG